jgi:hypothetical protein
MRVVVMYMMPDNVLHTHTNTRTHTDVCVAMCMSTRVWGYDWYDTHVSYV